MVIVQHHDLVLRASVKARVQMLLVDPGYASVRPATDIQEDIVNGLLEAFELWTVNKFGLNLLGKHFQEHGTEVLIRQAASILVLNSLPGTNVAAEQMWPRACGETMKGSDPGESHLRSSPFIVLIKPSPTFKTIVFLPPPPGVRNTMGVDIIVDVRADESP